MGSEDEAERSFGRPCRRTNSRSKRTYDLTSSIVPRGTSSHRSVELECPPIEFDAVWLSCSGFFPGPAELGAVDPDTVHDHGQTPASATIASSAASPGDCIAQAFSHDHFVEDSMMWAAS